MAVTILDGESNGYEAGVTSANRLKVESIVANTLVTESFDYVDVDYTDGVPTTVTYKTGGAGGTTVATLTITYVDGCIDTVTKV